MGNLAGTLLEGDEALVAKALKEAGKPADVLGVSYEAGEDADGEPSIWIWLSTQPDVNPSPDRIKRLTDYSISIRDWLLDNGVKHWPYIRIHDYVPTGVKVDKNVPLK